MKWLNRIFEKQYEFAERIWEDTIKDMNDEEIREFGKQLFIHQQLRLGEYL